MALEQLAVEDESKAAKDGAIEIAYAAGKQYEIDALRAFMNTRMGHLMQARITINRYLRDREGQI